jgi:hypothetical protein
LLGESIREIGVLVLVFVPLDLLLAQGSSGGVMHTQSPWLRWLQWLSPRNWITLFFAVLGSLLLYLGIRIEGEAILEEKEGG